MTEQFFVPVAPPVGSMVVSRKAGMRLVWMLAMPDYRSFERHNGIKFKLEPMTLAELEATIRAEWAAECGPDMSPWVTFDGPVVTWRPWSGRLGRAIDIAVGADTATVSWRSRLGSTFLGAVISSIGAVPGGPEGLVIMDSCETPQAMACKET